MLTVSVAGMYRRYKTLLILSTASVVLWLMRMRTMILRLMHDPALLTKRRHQDLML
jgi:hypothetical protein